MVKLISDEEVARCLDYRTVMAAIEQAFESLACGRATIHARQRIDCGDVKLSSMGAIWLDANLAGEKVYPTIKGQFTFLYNLFDTRTGAALAVMQANELTRFRTPALTALAVSRAAVATCKLALFGAGLQGRAHLECLLSALPFDQVEVVDLVDVSAWCTYVGRKFGVAVRQVRADEAVQNADVVVTVTRSKQPLFDGQLLKPGAFIAGVGNSLPTGRELDDATLSRADRIVVEWKPQSCIEAGEIVLGKRSGAVDDARIVDLEQIFAGKSPWRTSPQEIVVFKAVGVGLTDIAAASLVWKALNQ
jgi:ornithine cyclodeaminase